MIQFASDATSIEDIIAYRHWDQHSESFAGGDSLVTALYMGWQMGDVVEVADYWYSGTRRVAVYHCELSKDDRKIVMPVIGNPTVERMIRERHCTIISLGERQPIEADHRVRVILKRAS